MYINQFNPEKFLFSVFDSFFLYLSVHNPPKHPITWLYIVRQTKKRPFILKTTMMPAQ